MNNSYIMPLLFIKNYDVNTATNLRKDATEYTSTLINKRYD